MSREQWTSVERYLTDLFAPQDVALEQALQASEAAGLPPIHIPPNYGKLLNLIARIHGAERILEIGTLGGYSAIWLARALPPTGSLVTLEAEPRYAELARENIGRAGLTNVVEVRTGKAADTLPLLISEGAGPFDLIFIDADKPSYPVYLSWALALSRVGGLIVADNIVWHGTVIDPETEDTFAQGLRRFNELLAAEPRVTATAMQTVGSDGYDGFALALVTG